MRASNTRDLLADDRYMRSVTDMATRIDRILSGRPTVTVSTSPEVLTVPAYQHGDSIRLVPNVVRNMVNAPDDESEVLPLLLALNLHEYGHYVFTPSPTNPVWTRLRWRGTTRQIFRELNVLEDQRQELLVSVRFPRARHYFRLATLRGMLLVTRRRGSIPPENWTLYYGRRHILPRPLLARLESALAAKYGAQTVQRAKDLIDEYVRLPATNDLNLARMWEIADEMSQLFKSANREEMRGDCLDHSNVNPRTNKREQDKATRKASELLDKIDAQQADDDADDAGEDEISDAQDGASDASDESSEDETSDDANGGSDEQSDDDTDDDANGDGDKESDESEDGPEDGDTQDTTDNDSGDASGSEDDDESDLSSMLRDYLDRAMSASADELNVARDTVRAGIMGRAALKLSRVLKTISTDLGLVERRRMRSGRLDSRRIPAALVNGESRIFQSRRPNLQREAAMLVHIVLDSSGSMEQKKNTALEAVGTIGRACDLAGHHSRITTFSSPGQVATLKEWSEPDMNPNHFIWYNGGTNAISVLEDMPRDFRRAQQTYKSLNRIALIVTDGGFDSGTQKRHAELFTKLKRSGVHTFLIGIGQDAVGHWYDARFDANAPDGYIRETGMYDVDGALTIKTVADLEPAMRAMLNRLATTLAHDATSRYA